MKLSTLIMATTVHADYTPPKFKQLMQLFNEDNPLRNEMRRGWGHPVGGGFDHWTSCPAIEKPAGANQIECNQASCAVVCKSGYAISGNLRSKCKRGKKGAPNSWGLPLGKCITCPGEPTFSDPKVWKSCWVESKSNKRVCKFGCTDGEKLVGSKKALCKCNRKEQSCGWSMKRKPADWSTITCNDGNLLDKDGKIKCSKKKKKCTDVTKATTIMNSWTCRNCFRMRSKWDIPSTFDNRDHMLMTFDEDVQVQNFAHPMKSASNPSGDLRTWYIEFSEEAEFGDRHMDFTSEWRYFEKPASLISADACPCSNKVPK